jgi:hypothetical protein
MIGQCCRKIHISISPCLFPYPLQRLQEDYQSLQPTTIEAQRLMIIYDPVLSSQSRGVAYSVDQTARRRMHVLDSRVADRY